MTVEEAKLKPGELVRYAGWATAYRVEEVREKGVLLTAIVKPPTHFCENWQHVERLQDGDIVSTV